MCVAMLPCSHMVHGCPQPAALAHRGPCVRVHSALGYLVLGLELIPCVFPPYLGSQPVHFL